MTRILVIDDEASIRESMTAFLEDFDYEVESAESSEDALEMLANNTYDLAVVDMRLPGESGEAFILRVKPKWPDMLFLIHTGSVEFQLSDDLKRLGVMPEHVFLKPLHDLSILADGIAEIITKSG